MAEQPHGMQIMHKFVALPTRSVRLSEDLESSHICLSLLWLDSPLFSMSERLSRPADVTAVALSFVTALNTRQYLLDRVRYRYGTAHGVLLETS